MWWRLLHDNYLRWGLLNDEGRGCAPHWMLGMVLLHLWWWLLHDNHLRPRRTWRLLLGMLLHDNLWRGWLVHLWWRDCCVRNRILNRRCLSKINSDDSDFNFAAFDPLELNPLRRRYPLHEAVEGHRVLPKRVIFDHVLVPALNLELTRNVVHNYERQVAVPLRGVRSVADLGFLCVAFESQDDVCIWHGVHQTWMREVSAFHNLDFKTTHFFLFLQVFEWKC